MDDNLKKDIKKPVVSSNWLNITVNLIQE